MASPRTIRISAAHRGVGRPSNSPTSLICPIADLMIVGHEKYHLIGVESTWDGPPNPLHGGQSCVEWMQPPEGVASFARPRSTLPIDAAVPEILRTLTETPVTILTAAPGAGKTTRVPLAILDHSIAAESKILMLEPRRLATQRAAEYMASLLGEEPGQSIGYRMRGTSRVSRSTRVEVVTEGILTRMLQDTPELHNIGVLVFDEFHERSIHADLGLALALDVQTHLRPDLRILIMSATLDGIGLSRLLPEAPIIDNPGRQYPVETIYTAFAPSGPVEKRVAQAVRRALEETGGDILVFLPGRRELRRARDTLLDALLPPGVHVHLLHGEADPQVQRAALMPPPPGERKVILATSVAETSITIDGVRVVIDSGLARVPRFDPRRGMTGLENRTRFRGNRRPTPGARGKTGTGCLLPPLDRSGPPCT